MQHLETGILVCISTSLVQMLRAVTVLSDLKNPIFALENTSISLLSWLITLARRSRRWISMQATTKGNKVRTLSVAWLQVSSPLALSPICISIFDLYVIRKGDLTEYFSTIIRKIFLLSLLRDFFWCAWKVACAGKFLNNLSNSTSGHSFVIMKLSSNTLDSLYSLHASVSNLLSSFL